MVVKASPRAPVYRAGSPSKHIPSNVINVPMRKQSGLTPVAAAATAHRPSSAPHALQANEATYPSRPPSKHIPPGQQRRSNSFRGLPAVDTLHFSTVRKELQHELECDYDTNATELYELLESSDWERARNRSRTHPDEVRTWIVRKDKNQQIRWSLLPLHASIIFQAPSFLVSSLLERYPAAASRKDDQGMLPLHLAFRHKQEDEDLLELLLAQYPEAVIMRDRRDRVPLDHGRESRFSSKLMRQYAEAVVTATGHAAASSHKAPSEGGTTHTANTESLTHTMTHSHQIRQMEVEHEAKVAIIKADYEFQLKTLQNTHDERVEALQEKISGIIRQAQLDAEVDRKKIVEKYEREMNELRELLERQVSQDRATSDALQQQVNILQESLHDAKHQSEVLAEKYSTMVYDNEELRDFLDRVYEEQEMIQDMMGKQQEYMDAARAIRTELVQTLLQQEDQDGKNDNLRGTNVIEIASQVQRRINKYLEHRFNREIEREFRRETPRETDATANPAPTERRGPSRIEVERGEGDHIFSDHHGQTEVQAIYCVPGEDAKEPALTEEIRDEPATAEKSEEDYGEVRILADDISAITENSAY